MKAITILQPWASLIACGAKKIETRSWATKYRGKIAIHAGQGKQYMNYSEREPYFSCLWNEEQIKMQLKERRDSLPYGEVIAIADLVACVEINESNVYNLKLHLEDGTNKEYAFGDYTPGRYAWILDNVQAIKPIQAKGKQRIWEWEACPRYAEWPTGTKVKMVNCMEVDGREEIIWTTRSNPWLLGHGEQVVLLENYSGGFATECLEVQA